MPGQVYWSQQYYLLLLKRSRVSIPARNWLVSGAIQRNWCNRVLLPHTDWKHQTLRAVYSEPVHYANAFSMGSRNRSFAMKSCACASNAFLSGIISWSVNYTLIWLQTGTNEWAPWAAVRLSVFKKNSTPYRWSLTHFYNAGADVQPDLRLIKYRHNKKYGRMQAELNTFLILAPEGGECLASCPGRLMFQNAAPVTNWTEDWWEPKLVWKLCRKKKKK